MMHIVELCIASRFTEGRCLTIFVVDVKLSSKLLAISVFQHKLIVGNRKFPTRLNQIQFLDVKYEKLYNSYYLVTIRVRIPEVYLFIWLIS